MFPSSWSVKAFYVRGANYGQYDALQEGPLKHVISTCLENITIPFSPKKAFIWTKTTQWTTQNVWNEPNFSFFITFSVKNLPSNPKYVTALPFNMNLSFEILLIQYCNETKFRLILRVRWSYKTTSEMGWNRKRWLKLRMFAGQQIDNFKNLTFWVLSSFLPTLNIVIHLCNIAISRSLFTHLIDSSWHKLGWKN